MVKTRRQSQTFETTSVGSEKLQVEETVLECEEESTDNTNNQICVKQGKGESITISDDDDDNEFMDANEKSIQSLKEETNEFIEADIKIKDDMNTNVACDEEHNISISMSDIDDDLSAILTEMESENSSKENIKNISESIEMKTTDLSPQKTVTTTPKRNTPQNANVDTDTKEEPQKTFVGAVSKASVNSIKNNHTKQNNTPIKKTPPTTQNKQNPIVASTPQVTTQTSNNKVVGKTTNKTNGNATPNASSQNAQSKNNVNGQPLTRTQRRRMQFLIRNGMNPVKAQKHCLELPPKPTEKKITTPNKRSSAAGNNDDAVKRQKLESTKSNSTKAANGKASLHKSTQTRDMAVENVCRVAVAHIRYPNIKLSNDVIQQIKQSILGEIEKVENFITNLGFTSALAKDGWLCISCINEDTKNWIINVAKTLQPFPIGSLKGFPEKELLRYTCSVTLPPEDVVSPEIFLSRLQKQNSGLSTVNWTVLKMLSTPRGGQNVVFTIDFLSMNKIIATNNKLFFNFSRINIKIKDSAEMNDNNVPRGGMQQNNDNNRNNQSNNQNANSNHGGNGGMYNGNNFNGNADNGWLPRMAAAYNLNTGNSFIPQNEQFYRR